MSDEQQRPESDDAADNAGVVEPAVTMRSADASAADASIVVIRNADAEPEPMTVVVAGEATVTDTATPEPETGPDSPIVETAVELAPAVRSEFDAAEASARILAQPGSEARPARGIREETVALTKATAAADGTVARQEPVSAVPAAEARAAGRLTSLATSLWLAAAVIGLIALVLAFHPGAASPGANKAFVNKGETSELMSQAAKRVCAPFAFDYRKVDAYIDAARDAFVGDTLKTFEAIAEQQRDTIDQTKATQDCHAEYLGVSSIEGDRAVVVATFVISTSVNGVPSASGTPRALVHFQHIDGQWRITEIGDV